MVRSKWESLEANSSSPKEEWGRLALWENFSSKSKVQSLMPTSTAKKNNKIHIEDIEMHSDLSNEQSAKSPRSAIFSKGLGQTTGKINIFEPIQE